MNKWVLDYGLIWMIYLNFKKHEKYFIFLFLFFYFYFFFSKNTNTNIQLNKTRGYPCENYYAETSDGFLLSIQRIPHGKNQKRQQSKGVVFLQHGLLDSSAAWILNLPDESLAFILADAGFDVFLGKTKRKKREKEEMFILVFWNDRKCTWKLV